MPDFLPYSDYEELDPTMMRRRAAEFYAQMQRRRSVRQFSSRPIPEGVIEDCPRAAGTAPSGAHHQPWHFGVVRGPGLKRRIREGAEAEERAFYHGRAPQQWLAALAPLGTDEHKPFLEEAPALIAIFAENYSEAEPGERKKHYYVQESVGIATGFLIAALHQAGLACLTHTPSPMNFLRELLGRPACERPFLLLVVGYPHPEARIPDLRRKSLEQFVSFY